MWNMRVTVIPIVIGVLGMVPTDWKEEKLRLLKLQHCWG